ncbi:MAG TPA: PilZ domain-containing protein [Methylomirabilota bacterium]
MRGRLGSRRDGVPITRSVHSNAALRGGTGDGTRRRPRRYPRFDVAWPVVLEAGKRFFLLQTVNVSGRGAMVKPTERLSEGSVAQLHFHPPNGSSFDVEAVVWRVDRDGLAFFFTHDNQHRLTTLLAQLGGNSWRAHALPV